MAVLWLDIEGCTVRQKATHQLLRGVLSLQSPHLPVHDLISSVTTLNKDIPEEFEFHRKYHRKIQGEQAELFLKPVLEAPAKSSEYGGHFSQRNISK